MAEPIDNLATRAQIEELQVVRPVWELAGHEVCADVHVALAIAKAVLTSRQKRVAEPFASPSTEELVRELRALGVRETAAPTLAMVALVESAVSRLAEVGSMSEQDAWEELDKDVLVRHCQSPPVRGVV